MSWTKITPVNLLSSFTNLASIAFNLISSGFYSGVVLTEIFHLIFTSFNWGTNTPLNKQL